MKKIFVYMCIVIAFCFMLTSVSYAAAKESGAAKARKAGQTVVNYTANVAKESVNVVAETGKRGTEVVTKATKRVGQVATGEVDKTKELVTEPLTGTAETGVMAVEETVRIPTEAAKDAVPQTTAPAVKK